MIDPQTSTLNATQHQRVQFLEKQNEALLRALTRKAEKSGDEMLKMMIEQQHQILKLSQKIGALVERDQLRERQLKYVYGKLTK